jgi:hypothetical protein
MGFFAYWTQSGPTILLCFDMPAKSQSDVQSMFCSQDISCSCPYAVFSLISDALLRLYDDSVWALRNHISQWEAVSLVLRTCWLTAVGLTRDREGHKRSTTSFCMRLRDMGCMSAKPSMWLYGPLTLRSTITRGFVQTTTLPAATMETATGIKSEVDLSSSSAFSRACFNGLKRTMPESRMRSLL